MLDRLKLMKELVEELIEKEEATTGITKPEAKPKFVLGERSIRNLTGVHPNLVKIVYRAIELTTQDFTVLDGLRTLTRQKQLLAAGATRTLKSYHLRQADGYGHAVDLVPIRFGKPVWDWNLIYPVVLAVDLAATELGFADRIVWGGAWDRRLSDFGNDPDAGKRECQLYQTRHAGSDFMDGPHFQWMEN